MGRVDGDQKCPLIFFTLCEYIDKDISTKAKKVKNTQDSYGFQNLMSSWGVYFFPNITQYTCFFEKSY